MASVWGENMLGYLSLDIGRIYTRDELSDAEFIANEPAERRREAGEAAAL